MNAYSAVHGRDGVWRVTENELCMVEVGVGDISERQAKQIADALAFAARPHETQRDTYEELKAKAPELLAQEVEKVREEVRLGNAVIEAAKAWMADPLVDIDRGLRHKRLHLAVAALLDAEKKGTNG